MVWMLERSLKTLNIRVKEQTKNALVIAKYLERHKDIDRVYYLPDLRRIQTMNWQQRR